MSKDILTDLKVEKVPIKNSKLDKFASMLTEYKINIYDYLPKREAQRVSFNLNENSTFVNFIRACIWDRTPIWSLKVETSSIQTNDPFVLFDDLEQKIHGIPINQTFLNTAFSKDGEAIYKKFKGSFTVMNNTTQLRTITSTDMKFSYEGKEINYMCSMIPIFRLQPGRQLSVEMTIERGYAMKDANKFNVVDGRTYRIEDHKHISDGGISSLEYNPTKFHLSYTTYRNFDDPLEIMHLIIDDNLERLDKVIRYVKLFDEGKSSILHDLDINFVRHETQTTYSMDESYFLFGAISRTIYELDNDIEYVTFDARHLLEDTSFIIVQAEDANKKMIDACNHLKTRLNNLRDCIKK